MGNQLIKDTHIEKESIGNGGNGSQWEMHSGHRLDKNKTPVTVFLFEKKAVSKMPSNTREEFLTLVKKEPQTLARFKHPNILSLLEPLLEDQRSMGFVTEAVKGSLNNFINGNNVAEIFPTELDTKFHLLELAETISFLHNSVKSCHLAISPENVYVLADEKWKLGGFTFATQVMQGGMADTNIDFNRPADGRLTPSIKFSAPEVANITSKCTYASDIFSFGCLIYTIYKVYQDKNTNSPYLINASNVNGVQDFKKEIFKQNLSCIPDPIRSTVQRMLNPDPNMRINITDFLNHSWFKDPFIQTVKHLETLYQRDVPQQQAFLKGIAQIILKFEKKFVISKILPLINNLIKNEQLASSILPLYFKLIDNEGTLFLTKEEFHTIIWPSIKGLATGKEIPAQALYLLVQNSHLLVDIGDVKEIQTVFVPLLIKSFECNVQKLQVLALQKTEALFSKIEYTVSKSQILPRILHLCADNNIDIRKESLTLLSKIYTVFDKTVINDQVLTTLEKVRKLNNNYSINMTILAIFEGISKNIGIEVIANKLLISMIPMLVDPNLSKAEYKAYLSTVHAYLKRIEDEQEKRYEGMPDQPPIEAFTQDFTPKPAKRDEKPAGGEFDFLNSAFGGGSATQQVGSSSGGGGDFDFTGFDDQFGGSTTKSQESPFGSSNSLGFQSAGSGWQNQGASSQTNELNFGSSTNPKPKTNPMVVKAQPKPFGQESQGPSTGTGKNLKGLGNPFPGGGQGQAASNKATPDPFNFTNQSQPTNKPAPQSSMGQQNQNMFNSMKVNNPSSMNQGTNQFGMNQQQGQFGGQSKWDVLDSEIPSYDNAPSPYGGLGQSGNQTSNMNMPNQMFNSNQNKNQFPSTMGSSGLGMQGPSTTSNISGWDDLDIDIGGPTGNTAPMGTSNTFNAPTSKPMNFNQNNFNTGGGMSNQGGFNQGGFNQGGFNQGGLNQGGFNQGGGFNQNKLSQPKTGLQIGQKPQFGGAATKTTKDPFAETDDFFSTFDVKNTGPKKAPNKSNNDLL